MKRTRKILVRIVIGLLALLVLFGLAVVIFVNTAPQFGQPPEGADLERIQQSPHYEADGFCQPHSHRAGAF